MPVFAEVEGVPMGLRFEDEVLTDEDGDVHQATFILPVGMLVDKDTGEVLGKSNEAEGKETAVKEDLAVEQRQATREKQSTLQRLRDTVRNTSDEDIVRLTEVQLVGMLQAAQVASNEYLNRQNIPYTGDRFVARALAELVEHAHLLGGAPHSPPLEGADEGGASRRRTPCSTAWGATRGPLARAWSVGAFCRPGSGEIRAGGAPRDSRDQISQHEAVGRGGAAEGGG